MKKENILQSRDNERLQMIVDAKAELNYRELINFLELPYLRGNAKTRQLRELRKVCNVSKNKTKYKILEVYDTIEKSLDKNGKLMLECGLLYRIHSNITKETANLGGIYVIQQDDMIYVGQTKHFLPRFRQHYQGCATQSTTKEMLHSYGKFIIIDFESNDKQRLIKEKQYVDLYLSLGYNVVNDYRVLYINGANQKQFKQIAVKSSDYERAVKILKENSIEIKGTV